MLLIPVLMNPGPGAKGTGVRMKTRRNKGKKSWLVAAKKAGAVGPSGRVLTKALATAAGIAVPGFVTAKSIGQAGFGVRTKPKNKAKRAAQVLEVEAGQAAYRTAAAAAATAAAKKASAAAKRRRTTDKTRLGGMAKSDAWREGLARKGRKRGYTRGRSYTGAKGTKGKTYKKRADTLSFSEAAYRSGAVYPAIFPSGHPLKGQKHPRAGRSMSFADALNFQVPVVGYLSRGMIKGHYDRLPKTAAGGIDKKNRKALNAAEAFLDSYRFGGVRLKDGTYVPRGGYKKLSAAQLKGAKPVPGVDSMRRESGSGWRRAPAFYPRSGKTPKGGSYRKGARKADYKQSWSTKPAKWQGGAGEHLQVKFRKGRGVVYRSPQVYGFSPSKDEVDTLLLGGFGGPIGSPGGRVKLNSGHRGKRRKSAKNSPRNSKGRFLKRRKNGKRRTLANKRRRSRSNKKKSFVSKVFNNGRRRRAKHNKKGRGRKHARRSAAGLFVKTNGKKRRYRRSKKHAVKLNKRHRRAKHNKRSRRNPGEAFGFKLQLATLKDPAFLMQVAHIGVGITGTAVASSMLMRFGPLSRLGNMPGALGVAGRFGLSVASAGALSAAAYAARNVKLVGPQGWRNVLVGGAVYSVAQLLGDLFVSSYLPRISVPAASGRSYAAPASSMADWMELSGGVGGMGAVYSAADLVAGESAAQPFQMGGLGSGGVPIPIEDLRGYPGQYGGGLRDWVELQPDAAVDKDAVGAAGESF